MTKKVQTMAKAHRVTFRKLRKLIPQRNSGTEAKQRKCPLGIAPRPEQHAQHSEAVQ